MLCTYLATELSGVFLVVFGNSPDFWLNTQRRTDLWQALNTPKRAERIRRAEPFATSGTRKSTSAVAV